MYSYHTENKLKKSLYKNITIILLSRIKTDLLTLMSNNTKDMEYLSLSSQYNIYIYI